MDLEKQREIATEIYHKHNIKVKEWGEDLGCVVQAAFPCSEFAFHDAVDLAEKEIREVLGIRIEKNGTK